MVRDLVGEVVGLAPYEKRLLDMLKTGGASSEKRMYKFAKRRVSSSLSLFITLYYCYYYYYYQYYYYYYYYNYYYYYYYYSWVPTKEHKRKEIKLKKYILKLEQRLLWHKKYIINLNLL